MERKLDKPRQGGGPQALALVAAFLVWTPTYLLYVRPPMNAWLAQFISGYPALLHLVPILGPIVLLALAMARLWPAPQVQADAAASDGEVS